MKSETDDWDACLGKAHNTGANPVQRGEMELAVHVCLRRVQIGGSVFLETSQYVLLAKAVTEKNWYRQKWQLLSFKDHRGRI